METGDLKAVPGFGFLPHHVVAVTNLLFQVPPIYFELSTQLYWHSFSLYDQGKCITFESTSIHFHFLIDKYASGVLGCNGRTRDSI